ncbi:MAG: hypothetical protein JWO09_2778 [Bacteroidetes bacterium]|nr:hypothetical protein [Bacteroidota bacterium]
MIKQKLFILFLILVCRLSYSQVDEVKEFDSLTSPFTCEFNGNVKYSEVHLYELKGLGVKKELASRKTQFNEQKQFIKDDLYKANKPESEVTRTFSGKKLVKEIFCSNEPSGEPPSFWENKKQQYELKCFYINVRNNSEGFPLEKRYLRKDSVLDQRITWEYNADGKILKRDTYNNNNKLINRLSYSYDNKGRMISEIRFNADTTFFTSKTLCTYGANDSLSEMSLFNNNKLHPDKLYKYNTRGIVFEELWFNDECKVTCRELTLYDDKGNAIEKKKLDEKGVIKELLLYRNTYGKMQRIKERIERDATGKVLSKRKYVYDKKGNYIKILINTGGKNYCLKRKVKY